MSTTTTATTTSRSTSAIPTNLPTGSNPLGSLDILNAIPAVCMDDVGETLGFVFGTCKVQLSKLANITTALSTTMSSPSSTAASAPKLAQYLPADQMGCLCNAQSRALVTKLVTDCSSLLAGPSGANAQVTAQINLTVQAEYDNQCKGVVVVTPKTAGVLPVSMSVAAAAVIALFL